MTLVKWTIFFFNESTIQVTPILIHQGTATGVTSTYAIIYALRIRLQSGNLPAAPKGHSPTCLGARGCGEIISGAAVKITTESAGFTSKAAGQIDHKIVIPVITDREAKVSLYNCRAATLKQIQFAVVQDYRQGPQTVVNLRNKKTYKLC